MLMVYWMYNHELAEGVFVRKGESVLVDLHTCV